MRIDLFHHLDDPQQAFTEFVRVARAGARLVVMEPDVETCVLDSSNRTRTRKILNLACDVLASGWVGRHLLALFRDAGLEEVGVEAVPFIFPDYATANQLLSDRTHSPARGGRRARRLLKRCRGSMRGSTSTSVEKQRADGIPSLQMIDQLSADACAAISAAPGAPWLPRAPDRQTPAAWSGATRRLCMAVFGVNSASPCLAEFHTELSA